jgi:hypothetical protein
MPSGLIRIVFERPDGGVSIDTPIARIAGSAEALAAHIARIETTNGIPGTGGTIDLKWRHRATITVAELPSSRPGQSRKLRNAWRWTGTAVETDVPAGRAVILAALRAERARRLLNSDGKLVRANEVEPAMVPAWKAYRQELRDLPSVVETIIAVIADAVALEAYAPDWPQSP